ncbi:MAG: MBL fold metallo-hydrolase [Dongiaceae bacterium]
MSVQIADRWFEVKRFDDDLTLLWEPHVVPLMRCNIWLVRGRDRDLVIDTGMGICSLREIVTRLTERPLTAVATHVHADHIGGHHEFEDCVAHRLEADGLERADGDFTLLDESFDASDLSYFSVPNYEVSGPLITALPSVGYDLRSFRIAPAKVTRRVEDGDVVSTGDRNFEIVHLPGHSPGSIGLWEKASGILFSGDAIYEGPLLDELHHSSIPDYVRTMKRLRDIPARVVHGGHNGSFGRDRLRAIAEAYLRAHERAAAL